MANTQLTLRNRDLYTAQIGLMIISGAKRGKCDLYGTFKYHLSVWKGAVDRALEAVTDARRELRDENGKRDGKNNLITSQVDENDPNTTQVVISDPIVFEKLERQLLDAQVTVSATVPKLKLKDIIALDFGEQQGDYSGALSFIEEEFDEPTVTRSEA